MLKVWISTSKSVSEAKAVINLKKNSKEWIFDVSRGRRNILEFAEKIQLDGFNCKSTMILVQK